MKTKRWTVIIFGICLILMLAFVPAYAQPAAPKTIKIGILVSPSGMVETPRLEAKQNFV